MRLPKRRSIGFSLIEILVVVSIMAVLSGIVITQYTPNVHTKLATAAELIAGEMAYARNLAVSNGSSYQITFDSANNRFILEHSGTDTSLDDLPETPFRRADDPDDQQITNLVDLPRLGAAVQLFVVHRMSSPILSVNDLEFRPLGETTRTEETIIWLASGNNADRRYISVIVNPVTGLATVGEFQITPPPKT